MHIDDYSVARNEDLIRPYALKRGSVPASLVGCSLYMQARAQSNRKDVLFSLSCSEGTVSPGGLAITDAAVGLFELGVPSDVYRYAALGKYDYDIVLADAAGRLLRVVRGVITLDEEVTIIEEAAAPPPGDPTGSPGSG